MIIKETTKTGSKTQSLIRSLKESITQSQIPKDWRSFSWKNKEASGADPRRNVGYTVKGVIHVICYLETPQEGKIS